MGTISSSLHLLSDGLSLSDESSHVESSMGKGVKQSSMGCELFRKEFELCHFNPQFMGEPLCI